MTNRQPPGSGGGEYNGDRWTFSWHLSGPAQDPFLLLDFENDGIALLFDCGIRIWGKMKTVMKVRHLMITHAHIDHLIGFDHIVRSLLGESKTLYIHGPSGIGSKLSAKLAGYDWDKSAEQELILEINEYDDFKRTHFVLACNRRFASEGSEVSVWSGPIVEEKRFVIHAIPVSHGGSPCHAYVMVERDCARIGKDRLDALGVEPGPWVGELLKRFEAGVCGPDVTIQVGGREMNAARLADDLIRVQRGRVVVYITDTVFESGWVNRIKRIASGADLVVCESTFLQADAHLASVYHHMTSLQAAEVACQLDAKKLMLFHVSSRYHPNLYQAVLEARTVFPRTEMIQQNRRNPVHPARQRTE